MEADKRALFDAFAAHMQQKTREKGAHCIAIEQAL
jgi:hypothetical protein